SSDLGGDEEWADQRLAIAVVSETAENNNTLQPNDTAALTNVVTATGDTRARHIKQEGADKGAVQIKNLDLAAMKQFKVQANEMQSRQVDLQSRRRQSEMTKPKSTADGNERTRRASLGAWRVVLTCSTGRVAERPQQVQHKGEWGAG